MIVYYKPDMPRQNAKVTPVISLKQNESILQVRSV